jgi:hypothetical protein
VKNGSINLLRELIKDISENGQKQTSLASGMMLAITKLSLTFRRAIVTKLLVESGFGSLFNSMFMVCFYSFPQVVALSLSTLR